MNLISTGCTWQLKIYQDSLDSFQKKTQLFLPFVMWKWGSVQISSILVQRLNWNTVRVFCLTCDSRYTEIANLVSASCTLFDLSLKVCYPGQEMPNRVGCVLPWIAAVHTSEDSSALISDSISLAVICIHRYTALGKCAIQQSQLVNGKLCRTEKTTS